MGHESSLPSSSSVTVTAPSLSKPNNNDDENFEKIHKVMIADGALERIILLLEENNRLLIDHGKRLAAIEERLRKIVINTNT
jgi:hypothetical protein